MQTIFRTDHPLTWDVTIPDRAGCMRRRGPGKHRVGHQRQICTGTGTGTAGGSRRANFVGAGSQRERGGSSAMALDWHGVELA